MTTTSQDGKGPEGALPKGKETEPVQEPKTVPLGEHIETRQKLREALEANAKMQAALEQATKVKDSASSMTPAGDDVLKDLAELKRDRLLRQIVSEVGSIGTKQAEEVLKLMQGSQGALNAKEALQVLATRDPATYGTGQQSNAAEPQFGSLTPKPGSAPPIRQETDDSERRMAYAKSLRKTSKREMHELADNMIGEHLAKELDWAHKRLPIPSQNPQ